MTEKPFISICIPTYKRAENLERLLRSIAIQTYTGYELIISDDSPDDSVEALVRRFSGSLNINYSRNDPATGMPGNWNITIDKASGRWIKLMHDDDWFADAQALKKFADAAVTTKEHFIFSACNNVHFPSGKNVPEFLSDWKKNMLAQTPLNLFYANVIGHPSTVMHRKDSNILYDTNFKWVVDIDFYMRYLLKYPGYTYIDEMLVNIGTDDTQMSFSLHKNPRVEVPEYLSMLAKFPPGLLMEHEYVFHCVWDLVKRFRIKDRAVIHELGYEGPLPDKLDEIIAYQRPVPRFILKQTDWSKLLMKRCYASLKRQGTKR